MTEFFSSKFRYYFLIVALAALAVIPAYASNGAVVLVIVGALALAQVTPALTDLRRFVTQPIIGSLALLMVWSLVSVYWAPDKGNAAWHVLMVSLLCLIGIIYVAAIKQLDESQIRLAATVTLFATAILIALFLIETLSSGGNLIGYLMSNMYNALKAFGRGTAMLAVLIWPILTIMMTRTNSIFMTSSFLILAILSTFMVPALAGFAAILVGTVVFIALRYVQRFVLLIVFSIIALGIIGGPWLSMNILNRGALVSIGIYVPESREHRMRIWQFVSTFIIEKPITGYGFDASREIGRQQQQRFDYLQKSLPERLSQHEILLPLHPHNIPLQIWLELGAVGVIFYLGILFGIVQFLWRSTDPPLWIAAAGASTTAFLTISMLSFGAWQNWWIATAWLAVGLLALARRSYQQKQPSSTL